MTLTREQLLAARPRKVRAVDIDGGAVCVRMLYASEAIDLQQQMASLEADVSELLAVQVSAFLCDDAGVPLLSVEDARALVRSRSPAEMRRIVEAGIELNGLGQESVEAAGGN